MAFTVTKLSDTVFGNKRVTAFSVLADAATQAISTGHRYVDFVQVTPKSCTSAAFKTKINVNASGTAANGTVAVTGVASGDEFYMTVYGKK